MTYDEQALLGVAMCKANIYWALSESIQAEDFYLPSHATIWKAMGRVAGRDGTPDPIALATELGADLEACGGAAYIHSLPAMVPSYANWREYARAVHEAAITRRVHAMLDVLSESNLGGEALLARMEEELLRIDRPKGQGCTLHDALADLYESLKGTPPARLSYPWSGVQNATHGMWPGWLCVLAGETSHGKTAAAFETTQRIAQQGKRVLYVSLEMSAQELAVRLMQKFGASSRALYRYQEPNPTEWNLLLEQSEHDAWKRVRIERLSRMGELVGLIRRHKPDLVVVDHLHLVPTTGAKRYEAISDITREMKLIAGQQQVPILCLAQLSRAQGDDRNKLPRLYRLRDSGSIEQDADTVVFVWREYDETVGQLKNQGAFVVAKSRMGVTGSVDFTFDGDKQTFVMAGAA